MLGAFASGCQSHSSGYERREASAHVTVPAAFMELKDYTIVSDGERNYAQLTAARGSAQFTFSGPSGYYDIDVSYLSESVGQNTYGFYIDGQQIVSWLGKEQNDQWHWLSEQKWHRPRHIEIREGAVLQIEALSQKGSLGIFDTVHFTKSTRASGNAGGARLKDWGRHEPVPLLGPTDDWVTLHPTEYRGALKNPMKGFRLDSNEFGTLHKSYVHWNELENHATDGVDKIRAFSDREWRDAENKNLKFIPRVYLAWPGRDGGWPEDMETGDFTKLSSGARWPTIGEMRLYRLAPARRPHSGMPGTAIISSTKSGSCTPNTWAGFHAMMPATKPSGSVRRPCRKPWATVLCWRPSAIQSA